MLIEWQHGKQNGYARRVSYPFPTPRKNLTSATLEVLACTFKQPIAQADIDLSLDSDKCGLVVTIRDFRLVEQLAGGRPVALATTEVF